MNLLAMFLALGAVSAQTDRVDIEDFPAVQRIPRTGITDPRAFVAATYARYQANPDAPPPDQSYAYSPRLRALFAAYGRDLSGGDLVGSLDFDWWTNAQDYRIANVRLSQRPGGRDRRTIVARFDNYDAHEEVRFLFVRVGSRWYLDDAVHGGAEGWTLSALLRERP
ncbi:MAG TPA: hypothetical protein VGO55_17060 [Allosphingosinicella sp.]|jgi:hypothetical protein|nr:hypothetical protein [Allosphingosinicella sp.]